MMREESTTIARRLLDLCESLSLAVVIGASGALVIALLKAPPQQRPPRAA
jgi:hypothetical protein